MSDYFAALVTRTLRPETLVQPRPRAPFEEIDAPAVEPLPVAAREARHDDERTRDAPTAGAPPPLPAPHTEPVVSAERSHPSPDRPALAETRVGEAARAIEPHPTVRAVEPASEPTPVSSAPIPGARTAARETQPRIDPRAISPARRPEVGVVEALSSEPTVHIHIGRVDVRAAAPNPPAKAGPREPRREPRREPVPLDEYLRRRRDGRS